MRKVVSYIYSWYYITINHLKYLDKNSGQLQTTDSIVRGLIIMIFGLPVMVVVDFVLPIEIAQLPYSIISVIVVLVSGFILTSRFKKNLDESFQYERILRWRESQSKELLILLDIITFIATMGVSLCEVSLWKLLY